MKKIYCMKCRKFKTPKTSYIFYKTLILSIIWGKCGRKDKEIYKEKETNQTLKILGLINNI